MADDKSKTGRQDGSQINVNQDHEVRYWTKELGCSESRLREAVEKVGTSVEKVRNYLSR